MMRRLMESVEAKRRGEKQGGFTLIELIVVVVIIGILAAVAIPSFLSQRTRAFNSATISDSRNVAVEMESFFAAHLRYPTTAEELGSVNISDGVTLEIQVDNTVTAGATMFRIVGSHERTEDVFVLDSSAGQAPRQVGVDGFEQPTDLAGPNVATFTLPDTTP